MNIKLLKKLAKSDKYQFLYRQIKELSGLKIFKNTYDLSVIQMKFLNWLNIYSSLYDDLYASEPYISEDVINDDIRTDAYLTYKQLKNKEKNKGNISSQTQEEVLDNTIPSIIFTSKD